MRSHYFSLGAIVLLLATQIAVSGCKTAEVRTHEEETMMKSDALDNVTLLQCGCANEGNKHSCTSEKCMGSCGGGSSQADSGKQVCACKH